MLGVDISLPTRFYEVMTGWVDGSLAYHLWELLYQLWEAARSSAYRELVAQVCERVL